LPANPVKVRNSFQINSKLYENAVAPKNPVSMKNMGLCNEIIYEETGFLGRARQSC
jgi:hypothetical protein